MPTAQYMIKPDKETLRLLKLLSDETGATPSALIRKAVVAFVRTGPLAHLIADAAKPEKAEKPAGAGATVTRIATTDDSRKQTVWDKYKDGSVPANMQL